MKLLKTSMRDVHALAARATVDAVNAFNFRSPAEIEVFLKELEQQIDNTEIPDQSVLGDAEKAVARLFAGSSVVTAAEFRITRKAVTPLKPSTAPLVKPGNGTDNLIRLDEDFAVRNSQKLQTQFSLIRGLHDKLEVLDAMELTIKQTFAGERQSLSSHVAKTRKAVETKLKAALGFIAKAAQKKAPKQFLDAVEPVIAKMLARAKGMYKTSSSKQYLFVKPDKSGRLFFVFQHYLTLNNFSVDNDSFTYPQYVIVFTAAIGDNSKMSMHVTTLHAERAPGTFKFGPGFRDEKSATKELDALLDMDNAIDLMTKTKLPATGIDKTKFSVKQFIQDVTVEDDHVRIRMSKKLPADAAKRQLVVERVFADLRVLLGYGRTRTLKYKLIPQADKTLVLDFVLVPQSSGNTKNLLTDRQRSLLETHFGFDDEDISNLLRVMNRGF